LNDRISSIQVFNTSNCTPRQAAIRPLLISGGKFFCLDVRDAAKNNGALLQIWECWGGANQLWTRAMKTAGYYHFRNAHSGQCIDVPGGKTYSPWQSPIQMQQWSCSDTNPNQLWYITHINGATSFMLKNKTNSWCLALEKPPANGVRVIQRRCDSRDNAQLWTIFGEQ
jgi:hypothetical protein